MLIGAGKVERELLAKLMFLVGSYNVIKLLFFLLIKKVVLLLEKSVTGQLCFI